MQTVRRQLDEQDQEALTKWKQTMKSIVHVSSDKDFDKYLNKLRRAVDTTKRENIANMSPIHQSLETAASVSLKSFLNIFFT